MPRLRLLMLNYEFPPIGGGAGKAHLCILKQYAQMSDLKVDVLTSAPRPGFVTEKFSDNITVYKVGIHKKSLHFWRKAEVIEWLAKARFYYRGLLRENEYDLAHAFFGFPTGWLCYRTASRLPYIISLRGSDVPGKHGRLQLDYKILGGVFRGIWKKAAGLVACSEGLKNRALRFLPSVSIDVIPNGVELERFYPAETGKESGVLKLLTVGRLSVTKRVEMLIDAVEILHKAGRSVRLAIVGGGGLEQELRRIVSERNLTGVIEMTGRIDSDKMPDLYRQNNIFISATMQEGMSNAMLEAMASGLPIVTTRCEGVEELIKDNGIVVEEAQAEKIAEAIKKLADDRETCKQMSAASRKQAGLFAWSFVAGQYIRCYQKIL
ncbi:MAG TPA: glycosyltransferase family 4 protein [Sedimentisphaerales bacterium]|nr:glycosyltransferase family 4 protein [Sedimentisphaerales bacterium]